MGYGMVEAEQECVKAKAAYGIVAVAILRVAADGMADVGRMYANLVLATGLQLEFHK